MERIRVVRNYQDVKPLIEKLKEVIISEITESTDLSNAYVCGNIVGHSTSDDGTSIMLTIQRDGLQFTAVIRGEAASRYPDVSTGGMLYLYGGTIDWSEPEWSQASGFQIVIDDSSETNIVLLHKNIKDRKRNERKHAVKSSVDSTVATGPAPVAPPTSTPPLITVPVAPPTSTPALITAPVAPPTSIPPLITAPPKFIPPVPIAPATPPPPPHSSPRVNLALHSSHDEVEIVAVSQDYGWPSVAGEEEEAEQDVVPPSAGKQGAVPTAVRGRKRTAIEMSPEVREGGVGALASHKKGIHWQKRRRVLDDSDSTSDECPAGQDVLDPVQRPRREPVHTTKATSCGGKVLPTSVPHGGVAAPSSSTLKGSMGAGSGSSSAANTELSNTNTGVSTSTAGGKSGGGYVYTRISQLKPGNERVNVFGVVKFFKPAVQSRGTDFCSVLTVVDESVPTTGGLKCVIFNRSQDRLPHLRAIGDIVCMHRLDIQTYKNELQAMGRVYTSCICFDGKPSAKIVPRTGAQMYTLTDEDCQRVKALREWAEQHAELNPEARARRLCDLSGGEYFDLTCQVISRTVFASQDYTILLVWDGTRLPLEHKQYDFSYGETFSDSGLCSVAGDLAVPVVLYDNHSLQAQRIMPGQFVRLGNIHAVKLKGYSFVGSQQVYIELCIHRGTQYGGGVSVLTESDENVLHLKSQLVPQTGAGATASSSSQQRGWRSPTSQGPLPRSATVIPHSRVAFTPLAGVLACPTVPYKFYCRARVECVFPACVEDLVQLRCSRCAHKAHMPRNSLVETSSLVGSPCSTCAAGGQNETSGSAPEAVLRMIYVFRLVLEDESGHLSAYVAENDAVTFLPGLPPANLYVDQESRQKLLNRLYFLTGGNNPFIENPPGSKGQYPRPWIECCLMSYFRGKSSAQEYPTTRKVNYRIFDTILNSLEPEEAEEITEEGDGVLLDTHDDT